MSAIKYTGQIKAKGWKRIEFLEYIGYTSEWYYQQVKGTVYQQRRLSMLIKALPEKD